MKKTIAILFFGILSVLAVHAELKPYPLDTVAGKVVYRYEVEKSIGLYRISVNFGCTQGDILALNPELSTRGLHYGETILIPVSQEDLQTSSPAPAPETSIPSVTEELTPLSDTLPNDTSVIDSISENLITEEPEDTAIRLAILLPLHASAVERTPQMERFWDFYEGALLAIYDVQERGVKLDVSVFDTERSDNRITQLIQSGQLDRCHAVIGPAYPSMVHTISPWAAAHHIPVLIPFTNQVADIATNPYLIRFNASAEQEAQALTNYMTQNASINCVLVDAPEADIPESIRTLRAAIRAQQIPYTTTTIDRILADSLSESLVDDKENILILNSEKYSNISLLLPRIVNGRDGKRLTLLSQYSWQKEKIILPQIYTTVFATDTPSVLHHYDSLYTRYFHHEHASSLPRYDLLGYDLTRLMLSRLMGEEYRGLQSDIHLESISPDGGLINTRVTVVRK